LPAFAYVPNAGSGNVSVIDTETNTEILPRITVGVCPFGVAALPDGSRVYVTNYGFNTVSVIDTETNTEILPRITVGVCPFGVAALPDGSRVYVTNYASSNVSVIDTTTNTVVATIPVGTAPQGVAALPDGTKVYVTNVDDDFVSVINTATNTEILPRITVGGNPVALGQFIVATGKTLCGYLGSFGMGLYSFKAVSGEKVKVAMTKDPRGTSQGNQAGLTVFTATFSFFRQDTGALPKEIAATMPYGGIYTVKASSMFSFRDKFTGDYCLTVQSDKNAYKTFTRGILLR
jgi:YVTN family beta-propeller protein